MLRNICKAIKTHTHTQREHHWVADCAFDICLNIELTTANWCSQCKYCAFASPLLFWGSLSPSRIIFLRTLKLMFVLSATACRLSYIFRFADMFTLFHTYVGPYDGAWTLRRKRCPGLERADRHDYKTTWRKCDSAHIYTILSTCVVPCFGVCDVTITTYGVALWECRPGRSGSRSKVCWLWPGDQTQSPNKLRIWRMVL